MTEALVGTGSPRLAWSHPAIDRKLTEKAGYSIFASAPIAKGTTLIVWGGVILTTQQLERLSDMARHRSIQVEEDLHLCSGTIDDLADCVNHSCDPNAGLRGEITLIALRDIAAGEEITFDYATCDSNPNFQMECFCGSPNCRGVITGNDWKNPDLQRKYAGHFSPYLQWRINALVEP
ncbi:MAG: SET domain-containing protein-lysine N-methyltransferase [Anaerolineae bacterium]